MLIEIAPKSVATGALISKPMVMCEPHAMWFVASLPVSVSGDDTLYSALDRGGYRAKLLVDEGSQVCASCSPAELPRQ